MRSNSLGFVSEIVAPPKAAVNILPMSVQEAAPATSTRGRSSILPSRTSMCNARTLCCMLTSVLLAAGVGVGVWYAVTEI